MDKIISKEQFWNRLISSCEENWASLDTIDEILSEMPSIDNEIINDAHNEGYDVGYWAGRRDYEPRWVPVTERLPQEDGRYLITGKRGTVYSLEYEDEQWYGGIQPIAWMPLPESYKGSDGK